MNKQKINFNDGTEQEDNLNNNGKVIVVFSTSTPFFLTINLCRKTNKNLFYALNHKFLMTIF